MRKILSFILYIVVEIVACQKEKTPIEKIEGKWQGAKWVLDGKAKDGMDLSMIKFEFNKKDSTYIAQFAMMSEEGTFNLRNNCFNAHSIYGVDKKCPILRLEKDTMVWMMDSVHQPGNLYLVRVKE